MTTTQTSPTLAEATHIFLRIGLLSFGGPAAQIALMHRELVEERPWLTEKQFLNALSFCMLLPGPEAMQMATYSGWRLHGVRGGLVAGALFVLPGAAVIMVLATLYALYGRVPLVEAMFLGVKATVVVIVIEALLKVAKRALKRPDRWIIAALSFIAIFFFGLPFPVIIGLAAAYGALRADPPDEDEAAVIAHAPWRTIVIWAGLWLAPIAALWVAGAERLTDVGLFFSKLAVVTFGGAYAVLAYMTQEVVSDKGWLTTAQMMDGLGLAETTPGPLILVTQFVGYLAGLQAGGFGLAFAAATLAVWVTFVPCFLWIFAGAPYIDWIGTRPRLASALKAITAAVVGVILNLSIWFATHVFFASVETRTMGPLRLLVPDLSSLNLLVVLLSLGAAYLILWRHWSLLAVLALAAAAGAGFSLVPV